MDIKSDTLKNGSKWTPILVAIVGAFLGTTGGVAVYLGTPLGQEIARPDPYTGSQGSVVERQLATHVAADRIMERRLSVLEAQFQEILRNQARILDRLDGR